MTNSDEYYDVSSDIYYDMSSGNESETFSEENMDYAIDSAINEQECAQNSKNNKGFYEVVSREEIIQYMMDCMREVHAVVGIPMSLTRNLLDHYKWDKHKLMETFFEGDADKFFEEARIKNPFKARLITNGPSKCSLPIHGSKNETEDCEICCVTVETHLIAGLECGHRFCTDCWDEYLTSKIMNEGSGNAIPCAAYNCRILIDDDSVMKLIKSIEVKLQFLNVITRSFVECNRYLRWCPSPDCTYAVKVTYPGYQAVICKCQHNFCFNCGRNWHEPVQCDLLRKWVKKCDSDSETCKWLSANTKDCPKCHAMIEKDGGCNHMSCKNVNCRHEFCWVCLEAWQKHTSAVSFSCNRYNGEASKDNSRAALERYVFYCNRYMNHMKSLQFENKLYASVQKKMDQLQKNEVRWIETQFLKKAVDILCLCRQTLMYTYVLPYYLKSNNQSEIFENNQKDLETATECLSGYLERDFMNEDINHLKRQVQDKYNYCATRREALINHVNEGYEQGWWEYLH